MIDTPAWAGQHMRENGEGDADEEEMKTPPLAYFPTFIITVIASYAYLPSPRPFSYLSVRPIAAL